MVQGVEIVDGFILDCNPANGELIKKVKCTTPAEVDAKIAQALKAQPNWERNFSVAERVAMLKAGLKSLGRQGGALAALITAEMGKVSSEASEEVEGACEKDEWLDKVAEANRPNLVGASDGGQAVVTRDAMGVVVVLAPWNFPADEILLLALPALVAGNCVIVKPSEVVPLCGEMVVNALCTALPEGVLQVAQGDGAVGAQLVASSSVHMVAMTGSSAVGKRVMEACAPTLKRLVLELGGKDPMVVFADADLDLAARDAVAFSLFNAGQVCCAIERVYVDVAVKEEFERRVVEEARKWTVGPGDSKDSKVGSMVSKMQRDLCATQVQAALQDGATLLHRSSTPLDSPSPPQQQNEGSWHPVVVLSDLREDMLIQRAETFGPVVAISSFDGSESEAVRLANDTEYGLASAVYSSDLTKAHRVANLVRAGQVGINCYSLFHASPDCPWVGHKGSGFGYHSGPDGWRQFSMPKSLVHEGAVPTDTALMKQLKSTLVSKL